VNSGKDGGKMSSDSTYTKSELNEFRKLVEMAESHDQMDRINSRFDMPKFIERVGKEKCDTMFEVLKKEIGQ
jgi:hypothetical protein